MKDFFLKERYMSKMTKGLDKTKDISNEYLKEYNRNFLKFLKANKFDKNVSSADIVLEEGLRRVKSILEERKVSDFETMADYLEAEDIMNILKQTIENVLGLTNFEARIIEETKQNCITVTAQLNMDYLNEGMSIFYFDINNRLNIHEDIKDNLIVDIRIPSSFFLKESYFEQNITFFKLTLFTNILKDLVHTMNMKRYFDLLKNSNDGLPIDDTNNKIIKYNLDFNEEFKSFEIFSNLEPYYTNMQIFDLERITHTDILNISNTILDIDVCCVDSITRDANDLFEFKNISVRDSIIHSNETLLSILGMRYLDEEVNSLIEKNIFTQNCDYKSTDWRVLDYLGLRLIYSLLYITFNPYIRAFNDNIRIDFILNAKDNFFFRSRVTTEAIDKFLFINGLYIRPAVIEEKYKMNIKSLENYDFSSIEAYLGVTPAVDTLITFTANLKITIVDFYKTIESKGQVSEEQIRMLSDNIKLLETAVANFMHIEECKISLSKETDTFTSLTNITELATIAKDIEIPENVGERKKKFVEFINKVSKAMSIVKSDGRYRFARKEGKSCYIAIGIDSFLALNSRQITAVLLHEIGHNINNMNKSLIANYVLKGQLGLLDQFGKFLITFLVMTFNFFYYPVISIPTIIGGLCHAIINLILSPLNLSSNLNVPFLDDFIRTELKSNSNDAHVDKIKTLKDNKVLIKKTLTVLLDKMKSNDKPLKDKISQIEIADNQNIANFADPREVVKLFKELKNAKTVDLANNDIAKNKISVDQKDVLEKYLKEKNTNIEKINDISVTDFLDSFFINILFAIRQVLGTIFLNPKNSYIKDVTIKPLFSNQIKNISNFITSESMGYFNKDYDTKYKYDNAYVNTEEYLADSYAVLHGLGKDLVECLDIVSMNTNIYSISIGKKMEVHTRNIFMPDPYIFRNINFFHERFVKESTHPHPDMRILQSIVLLKEDLKKNENNMSPALIASLKTDIEDLEKLYNDCVISNKKMPFLYSLFMKGVYSDFVDKKVDEKNLLMNLTKDYITLMDDL